MSKRLFYVKLNLDDLSSHVAGLDTGEEYKQFVEGFLVGARGFEARDSWSEAKINGHALGNGCFKEAERFSQKQRQCVNARYSQKETRLPDGYHGTTTVESGTTMELPNSYLSNNHQLTSINHQSVSAKPRRGKGNGVRIDYPEETVACGLQLAENFPKAHLDQGKIPRTGLSILMERTDAALEEIRKSLPAGSLLSPPEILKTALKLYIEEMTEAKRFISGLGVWLSHAPVGDKANYRTFIPRAVRVLKEGANG